jgi:hypothetical protein
MTIDVKKSINLSRKLPTQMKELILKYVTTSSRYNNGSVYGLKKPNGMSKISKKISGCSMGADKNGFFVYTHRCRSKSKLNPLKITKKEIDFIESTG